MARAGARLPSRAAFSLALTLVVACATGDPARRDGGARPPARGGTLAVAISADIDSWNPYTTHEATAAALLDLLYPRLFIETGAGRGEQGFLPWLARSWEFSANRLDLTFHLREDAVWSDGSPVTCEDVRFTAGVQRSEELAWPGAFVKEKIREVDCADEHTPVFRFSEAYPDQLIDVNDNAIVPQGYGQVALGQWASTAWEKRIVTCGPFTLGAVLPGQEATLLRDPSWWGASETYLDSVILRVYADTSIALPRLLDGEVQLVAKVPPLRAADVDEQEGLRLLDLPSLSYTFLGWNVLEPRAYLEDRRSRGCNASSECDEEADDILRLQHERPHPVLADAAVRRALSWAIDRADLVDGLWSGYAYPGSSPIVSASWAHDENATPMFDPREAERILDAQGWRDIDGDGIRERDGQRMEIGVIVNAENRVRRDVLERVATSLERIGVRLVAEPLPRQEFVARARDKNFDAVLSGWWAGTRVQPQNLLHTRASLRRGNNLVSWSTPESDLLLDRASAATRSEEALPLWIEWQRIFRDEQPLAILYEERTLVGMSSAIHGPDPFYLNPYHNIHRWSIATDRSSNP